MSSSAYPYYTGVEKPRSYFVNQVEDLGYAAKKPRSRQKAMARGLVLKEEVPVVSVNSNKDIGKKKSVVVDPELVKAHAMSISNTRWLSTWPTSLEVGKVDPSVFAMDSDSIQQFVGSLQPAEDCVQFEDYYSALLQYGIICTKEEQTTIPQYLIAVNAVQSRLMTHFFEWKLDTGFAGVTMSSDRLLAYGHLLVTVLGIIRGQCMQVGMLREDAEKQLDIGGTILDNSPEYGVSSSLITPWCDIFQVIFQDQQDQEPQYISTKLQSQMLENQLEKLNLVLSSMTVDTSSQNTQQVDLQKKHAHAAHEAIILQNRIVQATRKEKQHTELLTQQQTKTDQLQNEIVTVLEENGKLRNQAAVHAQRGILTVGKKNTPAEVNESEITIAYPLHGYIAEVQYVASTAKVQRKLWIRRKAILASIKNQPLQVDQSKVQKQEQHLAALVALGKRDSASSQVYALAESGRCSETGPVAVLVGAFSRAHGVIVATPLTDATPVSVFDGAYLESIHQASIALQEAEDACAIATLAAAEERERLYQYAAARQDRELVKALFMAHAMVKKSQVPILPALITAQKGAYLHKTYTQSTGFQDLAHQMFYTSPKLRRAAQCQTKYLSKNNTTLSRDAYESAVQFVNTARLKDASLSPVEQALSWLHAQPQHPVTRVTVTLLPLSALLAALLACWTRLGYLRTRQLALGKDNATPILQPQLISALLYKQLPCSVARAQVAYSIEQSCRFYVRHGSISHSSLRLFLQAIGKSHVDQSADERNEATTFVASLHPNK